ncbi:MAG: hypothetical protein HRU19_22105 [Pseudobacteriovorax sp.]|nr:hypothetical protein [Pseudobacteriovorax sp.]
MKRKIGRNSLLVALWLGLVISSYVSVLAPTRAIASDQEFPQSVLIEGLESLKINESLRYLEDPEGRESAGSILGMYQEGALAQVPEGKNGFGFTRSTYWIVFSLGHDAKSNKEIVLSQNYANTDRVEFWHFSRDGTVLTNQLRGDRVKYSNKNEIDRLPSVRLSVPSGESIVVMRLDSKGSMVVDFWLHKIQDYQKKQLFEYVFITVLLGCLAIMAAYNFFIWVQLGKITYLLYCGFVLGMISQVLSFSGLFRHLSPDNLFLTNELYLIGGNFTSIFALFFTQYFLSLDKQNKWFGRIIFAQIFALFGCFLFIPFSYDVAAKVSIVIVILSSLTKLGLGLFLCFKKFRPAYFFTLAWTIVILGNVIRMLALSGSIPLNFYTLWAFW